MVENLRTIEDCYREMERILRLFLYYKNDPNDEEEYKKQLRLLFERKGVIEHENILKAQKRKADREARKIDIYR